MRDLFDQFRGICKGTDEQYVDKEPPALGLVRILEGCK